MGDHDVVIVGARCAGSPLAMLLARRGLKVCLLDKASFPSETPSTHTIQPNGVAALSRMGLADQVLALTEPIVNLRMAFDDARIVVDDFRHASGGSPMANVRRMALDDILVKAAVAAGVEFEPMTAVIDLLRDDDGRVTGVRTEKGDRRARLVVGADGTRSSIARLVNARERLVTEFGRSFLWGYFEGATPPPATVWIGKIEDGAFLSSPTDGGLQMVVVAIDRSRWHDATRDLDGAFAKAIALWPELDDVLRPARRIGDYRMMAHGHGYFRESAGPGWVLVGDAGHFKDPTPGQGISDALRQVEELVPGIESALDRGSDQPLHDWWRWRDRNAMQMYWLADTMGAAGPLPALVAEMLAGANATNAGQARFLRMLDHSLPPSQVMTMRLMLRSLAHRWRTHPDQRRQLLDEARSLLADGVRQQYAGMTLQAMNSTTSSSTSLLRRNFLSKK